MSEQKGEEQRVVRLASIVAVDIVGFSTMSERDQHKAARKVEGMRARIERVAAIHGGRLFNTASAGAALGAIQDILDKPARGEPRIRVGAHAAKTNEQPGWMLHVWTRAGGLASHFIGL